MVLATYSAHENSDGCKKQIASDCQMLSTAFRKIFFVMVKLDDRH